MLTLAEKIKWLGENFVVLGPYNHGDWERAAADLAECSDSDLLGVIGYSLGANNAVQLAARLPRKVDYLAAIQASYWGAGVSWSGIIMVPPNVGNGVLEFPPQSVLHFHLRARLNHDLQRLRPTKELCAVTNRDLHWDVDNDAAIHGLILRELKRLGDSA